MENADSANWTAFKEEFNQLAASEAGLDHYHRLRASADLSESDPNPDYLVYTVHGGRDDVRETYISTAIRAGMALGSSPDPDKALSRCWRMSLARPDPSAGASGGAQLSRVVEVS